MAYNPFNNAEIAAGQPIDVPLMGKVKGNFDNHEARLIAEETDVNVIQASQIAILDEPGYFDAINIEDALIELKEDLTAHEASNNTILTSHSSTLASHGTRLTTAEADIDSLDNRTSNTESSIAGLSSTVSANGVRLTTAESSINTNAINIGNLAGRVTTAEGTIVTNTNNITSVTNRVTTTEATIVTNTNNINTNTTAIAANTDQLSMACFMIDKAKFLTKLTVNTGAAPTYSASPSSNNTGTGAILGSAINQQITYDTFIPCSTLLGLAANVIILIPVGASITFGLKCYTSAQAANGTVNISTAVSSTGAFQLLEGHFLNSGVGVNNLPTGTRYVKPFIEWTNNTGTVILDYMSCVPLSYARYAILG